MATLGMSASEMLDKLAEDGVKMTMFSPAFLGRYNHANEWHIALEKESDGIEVKVKVEDQTDFFSAIHAAYDKWYALLETKLSVHIGVPQIEHHSPSVAPPFDFPEQHQVREMQETLDNRKNLDDEIPF